jgi:hypothetical protein
MYWWTDDHPYKNGAVTGFKVDMVAADTKIVFTFSSADRVAELVEGGDFSFLMQSTPQDINWSMTPMEPFVNGAVVTITLGDAPTWVAPTFPWERFEFGIGSGAVEDGDIVSVVVQYTAAGGGETGGGTTTTTTTDGDPKDPTETGIGDVAVASAIALVAVGAVVFSRKKK